MSPDRYITPDGVSTELTKEMIEELEANEFYEKPQHSKYDVVKRKNKVRNIPCPICGSGKKFKKCCW
jgi:uncharacterized protein YecA (UPF0149 family)